MPKNVKPWNIQPKTKVKNVHIRNILVCENVDLY